MSSVEAPLTPRSEPYRERVLAVLRATATPVDPPRFWDLMQSLGWGRTVHDPKALAQALSQHLALAECLATDARLRLLDRDLERAFAAWEMQHQQHMGLAGDLLRDLRQHLIGLGKATYEAALRNPDVAKQRGERDDYLESFGTAFDLALQAQSEAALDAALTASAQPFSLDDLREGLVVSHPAHGMGVVREEPWANRFRVSFREGDFFVDRRPALVP